MSISSRNRAGILAAVTVALTCGTQPIMAGANADAVQGSRSAAVGKSSMAAGIASYLHARHPDLTPGQLEQLSRRYLVSAKRAANVTRAVGVHPRMAFVDTNGELVVRVTTSAQASKAKQQKAKPLTVARSFPEMSKRQAAVVRELRAAGVRTQSVHLDLDQSQVVVTLPPGQDRSVAKVRSFAAASDVRTEVADSQLVSAAEIVSGREMTNGWKTCSQGIAATNSSGARFMISAGHCVKNPIPMVSEDGSTRYDGLDDQWTAADGRIGIDYDSMLGASGESRDVGIVFVSPSTVAALGYYRDGFNTASRHPVVGSRAAVQGDVVCKVGYKQGQSCGTVQGFGDEAPSDMPAVTGQIFTDVCSIPGDSGGPVGVPEDITRLSDRMLIIGVTSTAAFSNKTTCPFNSPNGERGRTGVAPIGPALSAWNLSVIRQP